MIWLNRRSSGSDDSVAAKVGLRAAPSEPAHSVAQTSFEASAVSLPPVFPPPSYSAEQAHAAAEIAQRGGSVIDGDQPEGAGDPATSAEVAIIAPSNAVLVKRRAGQLDGQSLPACHHCPELNFGHPLVMAIEHSSADTRSAADSGGSDKNSESNGISQLLGKILEQLNISAWLPAAMLIGNLALLFQLHSIGKFKIASAVKDLAGKPLGTLIVLVFSLLLAAIITQAFEFEIIRLLEGYIDSTNGIIQRLVARRIRHQGRERSRLEELRIETQKSAFMKARGEMLSSPEAYDRAALDFIEDYIHQRPTKEVTPAVGELILETNWRQHVPSDLSYQLDCIESKLDSYPEPNRLLPTRLGNVLRAAEDELELDDDEELENFVIRHHDRLPDSLKEEHKDYRTRLDMYCSLVLVFALLAPLGIALLVNVTPIWGVALFAGGYALMAYVCYEAAIASARGYGGILKEINHKVGEAAEDE